MAQIGLDGGFHYSEENVNYWPLSKAVTLAAFQLFRGDIIIAMTDVTPQKNLIGRMTEVTEKGPLLLARNDGRSDQFRTVPKPGVQKSIPLSEFSLRSDNRQLPCSRFRHASAL